MDLFPDLVGDSIRAGSGEVGGGVESGLNFLRTYYSFVLEMDWKKGVTSALGGIKASMRFSLISEEVEELRRVGILSSVFEAIFMSLHKLREGGV